MAIAVTSPRVQATANKRRIIFPILAGLLALVGLFLLDGVREAIAPWSLHIDYDNQPELSLWHYASHGATVGILLAGCMLSLIWQPVRKPLLLQMYILGFLTLGSVYGTIDITEVIAFTGVVLIIGAILYAAFPDRPAVLRFYRPGKSRLLLGLTGLAALGMAPAIARALMHVYDKPAFEGAADPARWGADIIICLALVIAGLLASSKAGGWLTLGVLVGAVFAFLGVVALTIPDQAGSWGILGGILSLAFAALWLGAVWHEGRDERSRVTTSALEQA